MGVGVSHQQGYTPWRNRNIVRLRTVFFTNCWLVKSVLWILAQITETVPSRADKVIKRRKKIFAQHCYND